VYDRLADKEFYDVAGKKIADFMDERYNSFVAYLTHVGYTRAASVPSILIITHDFLDRDAQDVVAMFGEPGCQYVRVICFEGDFGASADWADERQMRDFSAKPNPGSSIGIKNVRGSFSLGPYVRLHNNPNYYALSVHHGLAGVTTVPRHPGHLPAHLPATTHPRRRHQ
jgi:hypothetical protein